jgi:hypothetical protein
MSTTVQDPGSTPVERQSGRHPVNVGHLVMGIAFLGLVGIWALIQSDVVGNGDVHWLLPVPWVLAGLAGLLAIGLSGSKRWSTRQTGWAGTDTGPHPASVPDTDTRTEVVPPDDTDDTVETDQETK